MSHLSIYQSIDLADGNDRLPRTDDKVEAALPEDWELEKHPSGRSIWLLCRKISGARDRRLIDHLDVFESISII